MNPYNVSYGTDTATLFGYDIFLRMLVARCLLLCIHMSHIDNSICMHTATYLLGIFNLLLRNFAEITTSQGYQHSF